MNRVHGTARSSRRSVRTLISLNDVLKKSRFLRTLVMVRAVVAGWLFVRYFGRGWKEKMDVFFGHLSREQMRAECVLGEHA